jgi:hypothetical protein
VTSEVASPKQLSYAEVYRQACQIYKDDPIALEQMIDAIADAGLDFFNETMQRALDQNVNPQDFLTTLYQQGLWEQLLTIFFVSAKEKNRDKISLLYARMNKLYGGVSNGQ